MPQDRRRNYFNPRPPRGGRQAIKVTSGYRCVFQSTPSARRATEQGRITKPVDKFQSTPSARRATCGFCIRCIARMISIHALREESDRSYRRAGVGHRNFNPRPPRGERRRACRGRAACRSISIHALREESDVKRATIRSRPLSFQSTPSARRATVFG